METMTLNIEIPQGLPVDAKKLTALATSYVQHYVYMMQRMPSAAVKKTARSSASFKSLRGILSSDKSYKEMVEEAITDKMAILIKMIGLQN